jgi:hypothetical protein
MTEHSWRIDPARLPRRLDLEIQPEVYSVLEQLSARTGRSIRDVAEELIHRQAARLPNP